MDKVPKSNGPIGAQHISSVPRDDRDRNPTSLKPRTLPSVPISTPASQDGLQRVPAAPKCHPRAFVSSSKQPDQREGRSFSVENILNPVEYEDHLIASNAVGSPSLSELNTGFLGPSRSHFHSLPSARLSPYHQVNQEASYSQAENRVHPRTISPEPPHSASQRDSPSIQYSSYSQFGQTDSAIGPPIVSTGQLQYSPSNPSSGPSSSILQLPPSAKALEVPTSRTAAPSQYQLMVLEPGRGPIQVPVNVRAAPKVADEKRQRNATASHRFRQRRKEKERDIYENIAKLEAQVRETEKERDHYRTERDHFRDLAFRHRLPVAPRPRTPKRQRHAAINGASLLHNQGVEGEGQNGVHTRRIPRVPSQGLLPSAAWPPLQIPTSQCIS